MNLFRNTLCRLGFHKIDRMPVIVRTRGSKSRLQAWCRYCDALVFDQSIPDPPEQIEKFGRIECYDQRGRPIEPDARLVAKLDDLANRSFEQDEGS